MFGNGGVAVAAIRRNGQDCGELSGPGHQHTHMNHPLLVSTWSFAERGHHAAWPDLLAGGDALDAVERCCVVVEGASDVDSVGFGGLPDAEGAVSLDACVMLAPARCGSVAGIRRHVHPISIARRVMEGTPHVMLVGPDADAFADRQGFEQSELLAPEARIAWERWRERATGPDWVRDRSLVDLRPIDGGRSDAGRLFRTGEDRWRGHDTIGTIAIDRRGTLAGGCSTSGTPFKLPGRVGDSPIIGHGLYVDPDAGAATATGAGELVMGVCGSFLAVEALRRGAEPIAAAVEVLKRIRAAFTLEAHHQVGLIVVRPDGAWAAVALRPGFRVAVRDERGSRIMEPHATIVCE